MPTTTHLNHKISDLLTKRPLILQILRFAAIGFLNTGLYFLLLNTTSKLLGIEKGSHLGFLSAICFGAATIQSYFWNRYWAFIKEQHIDVVKNFIRLVLVGSLGALGVVLSVIGSKLQAPAYFYGLLVIIFLIAEAILWRVFGFHMARGLAAEKNPFVLFVLVSCVGLLINAVIVAQITTHILLTTNLDLNKNIATIAATLISLVWNFIGYKIFVFKK